LKDQLGHPVLVDNRAGAGGQIAAQLLKAAPPDGLTYFISHDHTIINALAAELPARLIRTLEDDKDVVAISYDSDVTPSGIWSGVAGTAAGSAYSLRSTLGLSAPAATAVTKTFQQGDANGYSSAVDGGVKSSSPNSNCATAPGIQLYNDQGNSVLIRFDDLFGSGPNQIPYGSTITSASLRMAL